LNGPDIVIGDLGTAKRFLNENTLKTMRGIFGTISYNAPEIFDDCSYSNAIDIWSFGCVLYEMIKLEKLFNKENEIFEFDENLFEICLMFDKNIEPFFVTILKKYNLFLNKYSITFDKIS
jgi:serine/threonine protein kinase